MLVASAKVTSVDFLTASSFKAIAAFAAVSFASTSACTAAMAEVALLVAVVT